MICAHCEREMTATEWQRALNEDVMRRCWSCEGCMTYTAEERPLEMVHILEHVDFLKKEGIAIIPNPHVAERTMFSAPKRESLTASPLYGKSFEKTAAFNDEKEEEGDMSFGQSGYAMRLMEERKSLQSMQQMYASKEVLIPREEYDRLIDLDRKLLKDWMLIKRSDYANDLNRSAEAPMQLARMEADIGKLRAALGTRLFDEIVDGKKPGNQEPRGLGNQLIGRWNGPVR